MWLSSLSLLVFSLGFQHTGRQDDTYTSFWATGPNLSSESENFNSWYPVHPLVQPFTPQALLLSLHNAYDNPQLVSSFLLSFLSMDAKITPSSLLIR